MLLSFEFIFLVLFVTVCSTVLSFNYDHQDILLQKIVFQIGDGFAIVESLFVECPSIREKKLLSRREGTILRETLSSCQLDFKLGYQTTIEKFWRLVDFGEVRVFPSRKIDV